MSWTRTSGRMQPVRVAAAQPEPNYPDLEPQLVWARLDWARPGVRSTQAQWDLAQRGGYRLFGPIISLAQPIAATDPLSSQHNTLIHYTLGHLIPRLVGRGIKNHSQQSSKMLKNEAQQLTENISLFEISLLHIKLYLVYIVVS